MAHGQLKKEPVRRKGSETTFQLYEVMECQKCKTLTFCINTMIHPGSGDSYPYKTEYFPPRPVREKPKWLNKLGPQFKKLLQEVYPAIDNSLHCVASTGIRTVLDRMMSDVVGDEGDFRAKASKLEKTGHIDSDEKDMLLDVIDAGSASAHRGFSPNKSTVYHMLDITEAVLERIYIQPTIRITLRKKAKLVKKVTPKRQNP